MKILAYTTPARGHLYPLVPILDELAERGHRIALRTLASEVGLMADRGFDAAPIAPAIEALRHDDYLGRFNGFIDGLAEGGRLILPLTTNQGFRGDATIPLERRGAVFRHDSGDWRRSVVLDAGLLGRCLDTLIR